MDAFRAFGKNLFLDYIKSKRTENELYKTWKKKVNVLLMAQKEITEEHIRELSNNNLKITVEKFFKHTIAFWMDTLVPEFANYGSEEVLQEKLLKYTTKKEELSSIKEILCAPEKSSFYQEEEIALAETKCIKKHQQEYFWLQNSYAETKVLSEEYFSKKAKGIKRNIKMEVANKLKKTSDLKTEIIRKFSLSNETVEIARVISDIISWQDERKKYIFINLHYKDLLLREIAQRFKYSYKDLLNAGYTEIIGIFERGEIGKDLVKREEGFGVHLTPEYKYLSQHDAFHHWESFAYEMTLQEIDHFDGVVASKGKKLLLQGEVKKVINPLKEKSFHKGNILVASMTSPEYVFLMEKAAAIITDNRGLTCHAAIVSREFEIPCIVGTKIATQVLKDGDLVEIDTTKGTITIIQRK
ncbi:hypothetical protein HYT55_04610 [Candidatus Woesearchaeota archaeon]|nr:hypothetical protein [Candidatus Woesearchaeota archaeon]